LADRQNIEQEIQNLQQQIRGLETSRRDLESRLSATTSATEVAPPITTQAELQTTLHAFVKKVAMILQAEKCVVMLFDPETGELMAQRPAVGLTDDEVAMLHVRATEGISGEAFRESRPVVAEDAVLDQRTVKEMVALLHIRNALAVPLVIERRNENEQVIQRNTIGVLNVFNKRYGQPFSDEDVRLLTVLARSAAAVISNARLYIEVAEEKKQLEYTLQSLLSGVVVMGKNGRIMLMNSAAQTIFSVTAEGGVGRPLAEIVKDEHIQHALNQSLADESEQTAEATLFTPSERIFQVQTALVRDEEGQVLGVVAIFNDVTDLRNVERMKTDFVSNVSHELRTPLTSIKGFIRTLLDDEEGYYDRETQREFYRIIDTECDRLVRLISDLLNVSRIESGRALDLKFAEVDLMALIRKAVTIQESYAGGHDFHLELPDTFPVITADEDKIDQVLANLLSNAIKYSPRGGIVTISARPVDEGHVSLSVTDQGLGIPPEQLDKIFTRFHRVSGSKEHSSATGTGIGLYLVKHLVEAHGGEITVESTVGEGSTFTVTLPVLPPAAQADGTE
jgi:two-component system phosphate regulon sensor histidine kinase PhoR